MDIKARVKIDRTLVLGRNGNYQANIKVLLIAKSEKFPLGIKAMKKNEILEIHFQSFKGFSKEVTTALKERKPLIQPKNKIHFASIEGFRNFMTMQKVEILTVIYNCEPKTIYELAKIANRNFAAVYRDCAALKIAGFINLKESKDTKGSKKPILSFPYKRISIFMPRSPYQIEFKEAA